MRRLNRIFKKKKLIGLALGGGAAKGMMHIGVIRYLEEKNITINHITGTSIGSVIGGLYALGQSSDEIAEHFRNLSYTELVDLDFSTGVIKGKKIVKLLDNAFKNERIENLPVRLSIVATNLSEGGEKVFEHGSLLDAVRHSISIPGLFALHHDEDHIYVDGGVVNNLPVRYLDDNDLIVASSCLGIGGFSKRTKSYRGIAIGENVLSFQKRVLSRSIRLMIRKIEDLEITQCRSKVTLIRPRLDKYSVSDFGSVQELIDLGYTEAKNILNGVI